MQGLFALLCIFLSIVLFPIHGSCDYINPGDVVVKTEAYKPTFSDFPHERYTYAIEWKGIPVAEAKVEVKTYHLADEKHYFVEASARTARTVSWIYRMTNRSESLFSAQEFIPLSFHMHQRENRRERLRKVVFSESGKVVAREWRDGKLQTELEFEPNNTMFDPISAAFLARSLPLEEGKKLSFDVFNGKHRYLISFEVLGRERIWLSGSVVEAFKVEPTVEKLTDSEGEKKLRSVHIWVSTDDARDVLKLESEVWVGSITGRLTKREPLEDTVAPVETVANHIDIKSGLGRARLKTPKDSL